VPSRHDRRIDRAPARHVDGTRYVDANSPNVGSPAPPLAQKFCEQPFNLSEDLFGSFVDVERIVALLQHFAGHVAKGDPHPSHAGVRDQKATRFGVELKFGSSAGACFGADRTDESMTQQTVDALVERRSRQPGWRMVGKTLDDFAPDECHNYIKNSAYVSA
jgi:hypothetical protein